MVKRIYNENQSLKEMAIINPRLCNQLTIQVEIEQRDEGPIPHVHVYHDKTRNPKECSYIRLDKCAYSEHHKDNKPLPKKLKNQFIELMNNMPRVPITTTIRRTVRAMLTREVVKEIIAWSVLRLVMPFCIKVLIFLISHAPIM